MPAGTRIRVVCTGVAIVHGRSALGGGRPIPPDTRHLDTKRVSMPPPIGHRPGQTLTILELRGAARSSRHQGEEVPPRRVGAPPPPR